MGSRPSKNPARLPHRFRASSCVNRDLPWRRWLMTTQPSKPRVLVVDDIEANRYAFEAVLEKDFDIVVAKSGEQALDLCAQQDFAVIVLDVRMPGMDGFDT